MRLVLVIAPPAEAFPEGMRVVEGVVVEEGRRPSNEELLRGSATKEILDGPVLPYLQDYQVQSFWGGTLVMSLMALPFFATLGPTIVALRMPTIIFAALAAAAVFAILDRYSSRRAAWIGGLLMAIAPPGLSVFGATAYGAEAESQTLALIVLAAFLIWAHGDRRPSRGLFVGGIAGFAIYFGYIVLPLLALMVGYVLWLDPGCLRRRSSLWPLAGILVGSLPWTYYNLTHGGDGLVLYNHRVDEFFDPSSFARRLGEPAIDLVWRDLPGAFYLHQSWRFPLGRAVLGLLVLLALAAAFRHRASLASALRPSWMRPSAPGHTRVGIEEVHPTVLLLAFPPLYALVYLSSDFRVDHELLRTFGYRYMLPFLPFLILLAAIGLDALAQHSRTLRHAASAVAVALCTVFLTSNLALCRFESVERNWSMRGYTDVHFARTVAHRYVEDFDTLTYVVDAVTRKRSPAQQESFFFIVAQNIKYFLSPTTVIEDEDGDLRSKYACELEHLYRIVPEPYDEFFEPLAPGERIFKHGQVALWRASRAARGPSIPLDRDER